MESSLLVWCVVALLAYAGVQSWRQGRRLLSVIWFGMGVAWLVEGPGHYDVVLAVSSVVVSSLMLFRLYRDLGLSLVTWVFAALWLLSVSRLMTMLPS
jgi:hypothetical protein